MGFDSSRFNAYLDETTGNVYGSGNYVLENQVLHGSRTGGSNDILITPHVQEWTRAFYGCGTLDGMALENQDGAVGISSHWERLAMYDELMTATAFGAQKGFSGLTFALLKDMGWYEVDDTFNDTSNYGYNQGCSFFTDACYSATSFPDSFCSTVSLNQVTLPTTNYLSKAFCSSDAGILADGCGVFFPYQNCVDPATSDDGYKSYTLEKYQTDSFCVESTFANVAVSNLYRGRCYPYVCSDNRIDFTVGTNIVTCSYNPTNEAGTQKTIASLNGYL